MPLDPYQPTDAHRFASNHVNDLLVQSCMAAAGFDFPVAQVFPHAPPSRTENAYGRRIFSRSIAAQWGYRPAPDLTSHDREVREGRYVVDDLFDNVAGYADRVDSCFAEAKKKFTDKAYRFSTASALALQADDAVVATQSVKDAMKRWHDCLAPQGIPDLPDTPFDMPPKTVDERFDLGSAIDPIWGNGTPAGDDEIALATADAECRSSSGFETLYYDANWDAQLKLLEKHADKLERERTAIAADWADVQRRLIASEESH